MATIFFSFIVFYWETHINAFWCGQFSRKLLGILIHSILRPLQLSTLKLATCWLFKWSIKINMIISQKHGIKALLDVWVCVCKGFITYRIMKCFFLTEKDHRSFGWCATAEIALGFQVWIRLGVQSQSMNYRLQIANDYWDFWLKKNQRRAKLEII